MKCSLEVQYHYSCYYNWCRGFSGCRRRKTDGLLQPAVVCVGIGRDEPRRHRWVQHSCSSHQSVRPSRDSCHQTLCSLQRTDKWSFSLGDVHCALPMFSTAFKTYADQIHHVARANLSFLPNSPYRLHSILYYRVWGSAPQRVWAKPAGQIAFCVEAAKKFDFAECLTDIYPVHSYLHLHLCSLTPLFLPLLCHYCRNAVRGLVKRCMLHSGSGQSPSARWLVALETAKKVRFYIARYYPLSLSLSTSPFTPSFFSLLKYS